MKAAVYARHGGADVVQITDTETPVPQDNEVLIRVQAAAVNPLDYHLKKGGRFAFRILLTLLRVVLRAPKLKRLPGVDGAGQVEAVGRKVTQFKPGDPVFRACRGAFAEYACAVESRLAMKPAKVTFEQAAAVPIAALTALQGLRDKGQLRPGQKVLINGAAGGVGTFAVQIAKWLGAEVTGVCSARNADLVRSLGAEHVIDYTREDFTKSGGRYDLILDLVANHSLSACRRVLTPTGIYIGAGVLAGLSMTGILIGWVAAPLMSLFTGQKFIMLLARIRSEDLAVMGELIAAGKVTPVIDRRYRLDEVPEAIRYLEEKHARGKVVITVGT